MSVVDGSAGYPIQQSISRFLAEADWLDPAETTVIEAVACCCRRLLDTWPGRVGGPTTALGVNEKPDGSLVTAADYECERILVQALRSAYPATLVVTEEDETSHNVVGSTVWLVDPLDGTSGYVSGSSDFAVLVSGWSGPEPVFSVAAFPAVNILSVARGSRLVGHAGTAPVRDGGRLNVHAVYKDPPGLREDLVPDVDYTLNRFESTRLMVDIARGAIDAAVVWLCGHQSWDLAAPTHLIEASGGIVSDETGGRLDFAHPTVAARYVLASRHRDLHTRLVNVFQQREIA